MPRPGEEPTTELKALDLSACKAENCRHFQAPVALRGKILHDVSRGDRGHLHGALVPSDGVAHCSKDDAETAMHLAAAGFREHKAYAAGGEDEAMAEIRAVLAGGNFQRTAIAMAMRADPTGYIAAQLGTDPTRWLHKRMLKNAEPTPPETRWNDPDDPLALGCATSQAAWRKAYFGK